MLRTFTLAFGGGLVTASVLYYQASQTALKDSSELLGSLESARDELEKTLLRQVQRVKEGSESGSGWQQERRRVFQESVRSEVERWKASWNEQVARASEYVVGGVNRAT